MSSSWDQKTEKPTEARRRLAREQGRVAVSRDLVAAFSLLWVLLAFRQLAGPFLERAVVSIRQMLQAAFSPQSLTVVETASILRDSLLEALGLLVPVLMAVLVWVLISSLVQSGWIFRPAAVSPDPGHLSPVAGFGRLFSGSSLVSGLFALLKCAWLAVGLCWAVSPLLVAGGSVSAQNLMGAPGLTGLSLGSQHLLSVGATLAMGLIVLGVFDWSCRRWRLERELMMTREELREELARQETPENVRRKQRGLARRLLSPAARIRGGVE